MKHVGQLFENCLTAFFDQSTGELFQFRLLVRGHAEKRTEYCLGGFPLLAAHLMEGIRPGGFEDGENGVCNGCPRLIIHPVNEEIPRLIAEGKADVMITEIMEAAFYCSRDARLAAPLINAPFTHGQLGALLPPGNETLRDCFNLFLQQLRQTGRLAELEAIHLRGEK